MIKMIREDTETVDGVWQENQKEDPTEVDAT
jgi:hypothetical protein